MAYRNKKGECIYLFGWLQKEKGGKRFEPTTGGNTVWAKTKREAIKKVNDNQRRHEGLYPNNVKLRVDPKNCRRAKNYNEYRVFSNGLYLMTV